MIQNPRPQIFVNGVAAFNVTSYTASASYTITPTSTGLTSIATNATSLLHSTPAKIIVKMPGQTHVPGKQTLAEAITGTPTARTVNSGFSVDVYAVDAYHNICTATSGGNSVSGTSVTIATTDPNDDVPAAQNFVFGQTSFAISHRIARQARHKK